MIGSTEKEKQQLPEELGINPIPQEAKTDPSELKASLVYTMVSKPTRSWATEPTKYILGVFLLIFA